MEFNKLVLAGLTIGCLAAAGGGAYLAVRHNQLPPGMDLPEGSSSSASPVFAPANTAPKAVTESEGLISPSPTPPPPTVAPTRRTPSISSAPAAASRASSRPAVSGVERVQTGEFGAMMEVALVNDGPVTLIIDSKSRE